MKFNDKELIRVICVWIHLQSSRFPTHLHSSLQTARSSHVQISCWSKWIWTDNGRWAFYEISYPSLYQNVTKGKSMFYVEKLSKTTKAYYLEPVLYCSITEIVEAMNTLIQERNNHRNTCITIKVSRVTQKVKVYLANEESSLAFFLYRLGTFIWRRCEKWFGNTHVWERFA